MTLRQIARELGNKWATPYIIQHLADTARLEGKPELAARLFGSAERQREKFGIRFSSNEQAVCDASVAALKNQIDSGSFLTLWNAGRHLRPDAALEIALQG